MQKWGVSIWNTVCGFSPYGSVNTTVLCGWSFISVAALVKHWTAEMLCMRKLSHAEEPAHIFDALFLDDINISWSDPSFLKADWNSWGYGLLEQNSSTPRDCTFKGCLRAVGWVHSFIHLKGLCPSCSLFPGCQGRSVLWSETRWDSEDPFSVPDCCTLSAFL